MTDAPCGKCRKGKMIYTLNLLTNEWQQFFTEEQAKEYIIAKPQTRQHEYTILFNLKEKMNDEHKISELQDKLHRRNMQIKELKEEIRQLKIANNNFLIMSGNK